MSGLDFLINDFFLKSIHSFFTVLFFGNCTSKFVRVGKELDNKSNGSRVRSSDPVVSLPLINKKNKKSVYNNST